MTKIIDSSERLKLTTNLGTLGGGGGAIDEGAPVKRTEERSLVSDLRSEVKRDQSIKKKKKKWCTLLKLYKKY